MKKVIAMKKGVFQANHKKSSLQKNGLLFNSSRNEIEIAALLLTDDFKIYDANLCGINSLFNKKKSSLIGQSFIDLLDVQQMDIQALLKAFKKSRKSRFQSIKLEHPILKKWYCIIITALDDFSLVSFAVTLITTNYSYQALQTYINAIINNLPGAVYWKDLEGHYMGCNKFVAQMAGYENPEQMIGKTDYDFCWSEFADDWRLLDNKVVKENSTIAREEMVKLANGNVRTELTFKSPLKNEHNEIVGIIGTSLDITERKEMEAALHESQLAAESANIVKTNFIQNMQHDIRTPASSIWAVLEDLVENNKTPDRELLVLLRNSAKQLFAICNEVIDFDRIERGDIPLLSKRINIRDIVSNVIELNQTAAYDRGLKLSFEIDVNVPQVVKGDEHRLSRILLNLIGNALKFTPKGSINLSVHMIKENKKNYIIQFKLQDTGIGIPPQNQETVYEKFNRLNPANRGTYKGSGLGLRIVKKYVDDMEGEINLESQPNKGTTFFIDIPFEKALVDKLYGQGTPAYKWNELIKEENKLASDKKVSNLSPPTLSNESDYKVLLIEDNPLALAGAQQLLKQAQCNVTAAVDVKSSLEVLNSTKFDFIISDIGLPDGTGIDIIKQIKKDKNALNFSSPFFALTANADKVTIEKGEEAGFIHVISKPLRKDIIYSLIDELCTDKKISVPSITRGKHESQLLRKELPVQKQSKLHGLDLPETEEELFKLELYPILDVEEAIKSLGSKELLLELLKEMVVIIPKDKKEMEEVYSTNHDWQRIEELAHKAKGGAAYCGTLRMRFACQYLERYRKAGYSKLLEKLYQQLLKVLDETKLYLEDWLKKQN